MQLSKYFTLEQLTHSDTADRMGVDNTPDAQSQGNLQQLAAVLDQVYDAIGPFRISSGYRSPALNAALKDSSTTSLHMRGMAADIIPDNMSASDYFWALAANPVKDVCGEIINESADKGVVHISMPYTDAGGTRRTGYLKYLQDGSYYIYSPSQLAAKLGTVAPQPMPQLTPDPSYGLDTTLTAPDQGTLDVSETPDDATSPDLPSGFPVLPVLLTAVALGAILFMIKLKHGAHG